MFYHSDFSHHSVPPYLFTSQNKEYLLFLLGFIFRYALSLKIRREITVKISLIHFFFAAQTLIHLRHGSVIEWSSSGGGQVLKEILQRVSTSK
jgi:hypothetical protein